MHFPMVRRVRFGGLVVLDCAADRTDGSDSGSDSGFDFGSSSGSDRSCGRRARHY